MLRLGEAEFELDTGTRDSAFFLGESDEDDGTLEFSIEAAFKKGVFEGAAAAPRLMLGYVQTGVETAGELAGASFAVERMEEAEEREDGLYVFETEPLVEYKLTVVSLERDWAHVRCEGTAITDGYSKPFKTEKFFLDCRLPVITCKEDWEKFGL